MSELSLYCVVCYLEIMDDGPAEVKTVAVMIIDGQSVCEAHSRNILANRGRHSLLEFLRVWRETQEKFGTNMRVKRK